MAQQSGFQNRELLVSVQAPEALSRPPAWRFQSIAKPSWRGTTPLHMAAAGGCSCRQTSAREYPDGTLAVFHGPRRLAQYSPKGMKS